MTLRTSFAIALALQNIISAAQHHNISGHVVDNQTGEPVLYANCANMTSGNGSSTNGYGFFAIAAEGKAEIRFSCIGYEDKTVSLSLENDTILTIRLARKTATLDEVRVSSFVPEREQTLMGKNTVPVELIKAFPSLLGEPDLLRALSYLPGVSMGKEGYSSIFVRGGDRGQDLVLLDGMKIYNTSHFGGFASLFNSDIVRHVDLYKGGFPAQFGGRTSSVIDVVSKDGDESGLHFKANIGLLSSGASVETPLGRNATMALAGRTSYYALFARKAKKEFEQDRTGEYSDFSFYDINAKLKWRLSQTSNISLSAIWSNDKMADGDGEGWYNPQNPQKDTYYNDEHSNTRNQGLSLSFATGLRNIFWRTSVSLSKYKSKYTTDRFKANAGTIEEGHNETQTEIGDVSLQSRVELTSGNHRLKGGLEIARYNYKPLLSSKNISFTSADSVVNTPPEKTGGGGHSTETDIYASDEIHIADKTSVELGLRATAYHCKDTDYVRAEPRIALRYLISQHLSAKANYTFMNQFNHVAIERYMGFEREIWMPASKRLPPQKAQQVSAGLFYGNEAIRTNASIELFGKKMDNLIEYFPPASYEEEIANVEKTTLSGGEGRAYGIEISVNKEFRHLSAIVSYTLSKSERRFALLNLGRWFPSFFDRRHELTATATYDLNDRWSFCGVFNMYSGAPFTVPVGFASNDMLMDGYFVYDGINNRRLPAYHRLDLSATYARATQKKHLHKWTANIFNAYAHENASVVFYDSTTGQVRKTSMTTIIPSISYSFEF